MSIKPNAYKDDTREIRLRPNGKLDEVIVHSPSEFHLERKDDGLWWLRIYTKDDADVVMWFETKNDPTVEIDGAPTTKGGA